MAFYKIRPKSGTRSQWEISNMILGEREIGFEYPDGGIGTGIVKMKQGDGVTPWNALPYAIDLNIPKEEVNKLITSWNVAIDNRVNDVKKLVANGKKLIGGVVGGNQDSTFSTLANNAQKIKKTRDENLSTIINLTNDLSNLNTQLFNLTTDRDNWINICNSRYPLFTGQSTLSCSMNCNHGNVFLFQNESYGDEFGKLIIEGSYVRIQINHPRAKPGYATLITRNIEVGREDFIDLSTWTDWYFSGIIKFTTAKTVEINITRPVYYYLVNK